MKSGEISTILLATGNAGKVREFERMFQALPFRFDNLRDFPGLIEVNETGSTFAENAALKASGYALQTGIWSLADDSGLEVDALDGAPGIMSARYGGPDASFAEKMQLVLKELIGAAADDRTARFFCSIAIADGTGQVRIKATGECEGHIAHEPRGMRGFGYDPIFIPKGHEGTFGELDDQIKAHISHRARAVSKIIRYLLACTGTST